MRTVRALRYVTPLREGGSLPALVEADDDGLYVVKLRGAGQGPKALVAEIVAGQIGLALGLAVPDLVLVDVDPALADAEPDVEIQELVRASGGLNAGLDFLPAALPFSPAVPEALDAELAADVVWFDALVTNVDRAPRNPNLLVWHGRLWLIDHGAALYRQHDPSWPGDAARRPFPAIAEHVLLPFAGSILEADERAAARLGADDVEAAVAAVPDDWLDGDRAAYAEFLLARLESPRTFADEAEEARARR